MATRRIQRVCPGSAWVGSTRRAGRSAILQADDSAGRQLWEGIACPYALAGQLVWLTASDTPARRPLSFAHQSVRTRTGGPCALIPGRLEGSRNNLRSPSASENLPAFPGKAAEKPQRSAATAGGFSDWPVTSQG